MPLTVNCSGCKKVYSLPETMRGKTVRCKDCQAMFTVQEEAAGTAAAVAAPQAPTVTSTCPNCQSVYQLPAAMTGKQVRCKKCQGTFVAGKALAPVAKEEAVIDDETEAMMARRREQVRARREGVSLPGSTEEEVHEVVDEDEQGTRSPKVPVQIAPDLDGSPRPNRFPVAVLSVLGGMALMALVVLVLLVAGGIVLAGKVNAIKEKNDAARAAFDAQQKAAKLTAAAPKNLDDAIRNVKDQDAIKRKGALDYLQQAPVDVGRKKELGEALTVVLRSNKDDQRLAAFKILETWGPLPETEGAACDAFKSTNKEVRAAAMPYLAKFDVKRCYDALSDGLKNEDDRELAITYLTGAGPKAEPSLWPRLKESPDTVKGACKVLGAIGGNESKKRLEAAKKGAPPEVAAAIQEAMQAIEVRAKQK
jgi:LSD1 subclass zinc finger protein